MSVRKHVVASMGDSQTAGVLAGTTYSAILETWLGPQYLCANLGHVGDQTSSGVLTGNMTDLYKSVVKGAYLKPSASYHRILTMMIGVNNFALGTPSSNSAANAIASSALSDLAAVYNDAIGDGNWDMVIAITPPPANAYFTSVQSLTGGIATYGSYMEYGFEGVGNSSSYVAGIKALSVSGLTVLDANGALASTNTGSYPNVYSTGTTYSQSSTKPDYVTQPYPSDKDYLHPNLCGHAAIAALIYNAIKGAGY